MLAYTTLQKFGLVTTVYAKLFESFTARRCVRIFVLHYTTKNMERCNPCAKINFVRISTVLKVLQQYEKSCGVTRGRQKSRNNARISQEDVEDENEKLRKLIAANFGRLKNDPIKQSRLITEYERLAGVTHGGDRKSSGHNVSLKQEDIAKQLGVDVRTLRRLKELSTLSPDLQEIISSGQITPTTGFKVLAKLSEEEQQQLIKMLPALGYFWQCIENRTDYT